MQTIVAETPSTQGKYREMAKLELVDGPDQLNANSCILMQLILAF